MPTTIPPDAVVAAYLAPTTRHTRRIEIYEKDGVTRWAKDQTERLIDGTVTVDYTRDERRALDLTLDNSDEVLVNAPGEFWYDKVIKVFRGLDLRQPLHTPRIAVIADNTLAASRFTAFRAALVAMGFDNVQSRLDITTYEQTKTYDIIVALAPGKHALLKTVHDAGRPVATFGSDTSAGYIQAVYGAAAAAGTLGSGYKTLTPKVVAHPVATGWSTFTTTSTIPGPVYGPSISSEVVEIANIGASAPAMSNVLAATNPVTGARAVMFQNKFSNNDFTIGQMRNLMVSTFNWLNVQFNIDQWEVQVGEFVIDRIVETNYPNTMQLTCRDYTKKMMLALYTTATQYTAGNSLEYIVRAIATAAGITKMTLPATGVTVTQDFFFDRGVTRWSAVKDICTAYNYEVFFNALGYLTIKPNADPYLQPATLTVQTGPSVGNMASFEKSTNDSRVFNTVVVTGESSDSAIPPVSYVAVNSSPTSPTSTVNLGPRMQTYDSAFITTVTQAQDLANLYLSIAALEEYDINFDSLMFPWLEAGDILKIIDPKAAPDDPTSFLLSTLSIPLGLAPMSSNAKRIVQVS